MRKLFLCLSYAYFNQTYEILILTSANFELEMFVKKIGVATLFWLQLYLTIDQICLRFSITSNVPRKLPYNFLKCSLAALACPRITLILKCLNDHTFSHT